MALHSTCNTIAVWRNPGVRCKINAACFCASTSGQMIQSSDDGSKIFIFNLFVGRITMRSIYLSKKDVARKLGISSSTVNRWAKSGIIPMPFSLGPNKVTWDENEIDEVINLRKKENRGFLGHKPKSQ